MARVVVTGPAEADVAEIVVYLTENAGRQVAERYLGEFDAVYDRLAEFPNVGPPDRRSVATRVSPWCTRM
jgi:plasmid stabilization system protein ParE